MDCIGLRTPWKESPIAACNRLQRSAVSIKQSKAKHSVGFRYGRPFDVLRSVQNICSINDTKSKTLYEVLGIGEDATAKDIKAAYRKLARRFHPDVVSSDHKGSGSRMFLEIHDAYATLSDPRDRARYDLRLGAEMRGQPWRASGYRYSSGQCGSHYVGRNWETDQCW